MTAYGFTVTKKADWSQTAPLGFGGLHTSLLGLTSVVLAEQDWLATVQPSNDDEQIDAETVIPGESPFSALRSR